MVIATVSHRIPSGEASASIFSLSRMKGTSLSIYYMCKTDVIGILPDGRSQPLRPTTIMHHKCYAIRESRHQNPAQGW